MCTGGFTFTKFVGNIRGTKEYHPRIEWNWKIFLEHRSGMRPNPLENVYHIVNLLALFYGLNIVWNDFHLYHL